jgi:hypothetical protein
MSVIVVALAAAGCEATLPSSPHASVPASASAPSSAPATVGPPSASPDPSLWSQVPYEDVDQAEELAAVPTDSGGQLPPCAECQGGAVAVMSGVASGPDGFVAVGWISPDFHGAIWHSTDGHRWSLGPRLDPNTQLTAVTAGQTRFVAVGMRGSAAQALASTDGVSWTVTEDESAFSQPLTHLTSVTHWSGGFAAGGYFGDEFGQAEAAVWLSPDGRRWTRVPDAGTFADARVYAIGADGSGLVAVGRAGPSGGSGPGVVWMSSDGRSWTRVPGQAAFDQASMRTVAAVPGIGLVAGGTDARQTTALAWTSADGRTWARIPLGGASGLGSRVTVAAVVAGGPGAVAVGSAASDAQSTSAVVWTSPDGRHWSRMPSGSELAYAEMTGVTGAGSGLIAVGDASIPDEPIAAVWLSPASWGP